MHEIDSSSHRILVVFLQMQMCNANALKGTMLKTLWSSQQISLVVYSWNRDTKNLVMHTKLVSLDTITSISCRLLINRSDPP